MALSPELTHFLASVHPYDSLPDDVLGAVSEECEVQSFAPGETVFSVGEKVEGLYVIAEGEVEVTDETDVQLSLLGPRNSFGERALLRGDTSLRTARATQQLRAIRLPPQTFQRLIDQHASVSRFFDRRRPARAQTDQFHTKPVAHVMSRDVVSCAPHVTIKEAASLMDARGVSSICIGEGPTLAGILTLCDLNRHVVAGDHPSDAPVGSIMTPEPLCLPPSALITDVLHLMVERRIGHVPITEDGRVVGIVTQTDLTRAQSLTTADIVRRVSQAEDADVMAQAIEKLPQLLVQLVDGGNEHHTVTRLITDVADAATRRLLALAEAELGAPPVPYLWLACGSQGRQEQTGVSDQDNCLILSDQTTADDRPYFAALAKFVSDGLDRCGYFYCPGDMMATAPRWMQPLAQWRDYFTSWISKPNPEAQMLASVMFDLRPIGGDERLFEGLQAEVLDAAAENSIFVAHMVSNSLKHYPPLGLLRGLATIRSGEHRNALDLKHNGVVPIVDLARIYALSNKLRPVNSRARLEAGIKAGALSTSGGADLIDAYDLIAETRLKHQAEEIRRGQEPTNFLKPGDLSDFERSHLRDAFVVVKTMQSAVGSGKGMLG